MTPTIEAIDLKTWFPVRGGMLHAVDGISFAIYPGETLGVVGESGCGKSTLGRTLIGLNKPTSGQILFHGEEISQMKGRRKKELHTRMSMIFQDPYSSLNSRMCVADLIADPMLVNHGLGV